MRHGAFTQGRRHMAQCRFRPRLTVLENRTVPAAVLATGADAGGGPHVKVFAADGTALASFFAYDPTFRGGVRVATGDVTGDGVDDLVTAPGPGAAPLVKVYDGAALVKGVVRELRSFFAYDVIFEGGVTIAIGDITGDRRLDLVTGAGPGGGPHVKVFNGATGSEVSSFFAYDPIFRGGVNVAAGYIVGPGSRDQILTGAGPGGGPHVKVFNGLNGGLVRSFMAYDSAFRGGVSVATGYLTADGQADIITGAGAGGGPHVRVFDGFLGNIVREFMAGDAAFRGGVRVAAADLNGDGWSEIVAAPGAGGTPQARVFDGATGMASFALMAYDPAFRGGVSVGGLVPTDANAATTLAFDFRTGDAQGWDAGFANGPVGNPAAIHWDAGLRPLPAELGPGTGFQLQGNNTTDSLIMFLKRVLGPGDGVAPDQVYRVRFDIEFGSNVPPGLAGIGGAPGESVLLLAGAGAEEPRVVPVGENFADLIVDPNQIDRYTQVLGNIANGQPPVRGTQPYVAVRRTGTLTFPAQSDADGNLWLLVGTASGFEGFTRLYYLNITVTLLPLDTVP